VRNKSVWEHACGLTRTVVEGVDYDDDAHAVVVSVRPVAKARSRCGLCGHRSPGYDLGDGRRRWRALDLGTTRVFVEAAGPTRLLPIAWGDGRGGAVGPTRRRPHPRLRRRRARGCCVGAASREGAESVRSVRSSFTGL
jgi:hypothetical protein